MMALKDIKKGEELYVNYGYQVESPFIQKFAPWFVKQHEFYKEYIEKLNNVSDLTPP